MYILNLIVEYDICSELHKWIDVASKYSFYRKITMFDNEIGFVNIMVVKQWVWCTGMFQAPEIRPMLLTCVNEADKVVSDLDKGGIF